MQRLITALVALFSLLAANLYPAGAQGQTEPPPIAAPAPFSGGEHNLSGRRDLPTMPDRQARAYEVPAGQIVATLVVRNRNFVLAGRVTQDVMAINCNTIIRPGASVGNVLTAVGGTVNNQAGEKVRVVEMSAALVPELEAPVVTANVTPPPVMTSPSPTSLTLRANAPAAPPSWAGGQFALLLLGLLSGLLALVVAPRATERTGENLALEPGRCLVVGALGAAAMLAALAFSYGLMRSPFSPVWTPLGAGFAALCLMALAFGWVCGMRYVGQRFARRLGRGGIRGLFLQVAVGLVAFFLANVILGCLSTGMGVISLLLEFTLALSGLGAAILSGFGADPNWLTARMRGEVRWLSRTPRL